MILRQLPKAFFHRDTLFISTYVLTVALLRISSVGLQIFFQSTAIAFQQSFFIYN